MKLVPAIKTLFSHLIHFITYIENTDSTPRYTFYVVFHVVNVPPNLYFCTHFVNLMSLIGPLVCFVEDLRAESSRLDVY